MLQDTICYQAQQCIGLRYGDSSKRQAYKQQLFRFDKPSDQESMARVMISCMIFARSLMADNEVDGTITYRGRPRVDVLREPYAKHVGQIDDLVQELARQRGLRFRSSDVTTDALEAMIEPGTLVVHGAGGSLPTDIALRQKHLDEWGGIAHGLVVVDRKGDKLFSVDGGQLDLNNRDNNGRSRSTAIEDREREISVRNGKLWVGDRRVNYIVPMHKLPVVRP